MNKIIIGENIIKTLGEGAEKHNVLDGVSIEIGAGEFVSIMGPSGSGKSTLMFALSGMDSIDGGRVIFDGKDLAELGEDGLSDLRRRKMGFVFQQPTMLKNLNIEDNIILPAMGGKKSNSPEILERAAALMERTGITELQKRDITQVSGGQLQRAGICRALMGNPKIIFGDEPTGALNSKSAQEILDLFSDINADGTAVMLVTHDPKVAARTQRIMFMVDGKIVAETRFAKASGIDIDDRMKIITAKMQEIGV